MNHKRSQSGVKKRSSTACQRCRQQKIKCTGLFPCEPCIKRKLDCYFDDRTQKVFVTKGVLADLQRKANVGQQRESQTLSAHGATSTEDNEALSLSEDEVSTWLDGIENDHVRKQDLPAQRAQNDLGVEVEHESASSDPQLMNPLAIDAANYTAHASGKPFYLGPSSNWSFGHRVFNMACEHLRVQAPLEPLHFEGLVYNLDWNSLDSSPKTVKHSLPSADYAIYLIDAVRFHCGQMFHLFDEAEFMKHFTIFHKSVDGLENVPSQWYIHYLLIVAFGKAFTARSVKGDRPPGSDVFLEAMRRLPEIIFPQNDIIEAIEILCCAALYLQCLDFRIYAYNLIGQALRNALAHGFHTRMQGTHLPSQSLQRCRRVWWTIYVLDRQMSSLIGLPTTIRDEDISAPIPESLNLSHNSLGLELHVKLSRVIAQILNTVYSTEGRLDKKFLGSTKIALKNIASITSLLHTSFEMPESSALAGISRLSAYLHLLHHQCICLATRPLAFALLERKLRNAVSQSQSASPSGSVRMLLKTSVDSAQQMLYILEGLQNQNLLESFLPFDLESVFVAMIIIIMISAIDRTLTESNNLWVEVGYTILDEMAGRGNAVAAHRKRELNQLATILDQTRSTTATLHENINLGSINERVTHPQEAGTERSVAANGAMQHQQARQAQIFETWTSQEEITAEQLMLLADSLDFQGLDWMTASWDEASSHINT